jgi:hypothetical protein
LNRRSSRLALVAVAASLVIAGCGGDDDETTADEGTSGATGATAAAPIALDDWIDQADTICSEETAAIDEAAAETFTQGEQPDEAALTEFAGETVIPSLQAQYDAISALPPPEGEEEAAEELLGSLQSAIEEVEQDPSALADQSAEGAFAEANALAAELGLRECGEG